MNNKIAVCIGMCMALTAPALAQELGGHWRIPNSDGPKGSVVFSGDNANGYTVEFTLPDRTTRVLSGTFDGKTLTLTEGVNVADGAGAAAASVPNTANSRGARGALLDEEEREGDEDLDADEDDEHVPLDDDAPAIKVGTYVIGKSEVKLPRQPWLLWTRPRSIPMFVFKATTPVDAQGMTPVARFGRANIDVTIVAYDDEPADGLLAGENYRYKVVVSPDTRGKVLWSCADESVSLRHTDEERVSVRTTKSGEAILTATWTTYAGSKHVATHTLVTRQSIESVEVVAVTFSSDHGVMKDNATDWTNSGTLLPEPEWTEAKQHPISHTMDKKVTVTVELEVGPAGASPVKGKLIAKGGGLTFEAEVTFKSGKMTVELDSGKTKLAKKIQKLDLALEWSVEGVVGVDALATTHTPTFVTMDTPRAPGRRPGFTVKRMEKAIEACGLPDSDDPPTIVVKVMQKWDHFNLKVAYRNAWLLGDDKKDPTTNTLIGADCQTIVRFTQNAISMAGVPGKAEYVVVYAKATAPAKGLESLNARNHMSKPYQKYNAHVDASKRDTAKNWWIAILVDSRGGLNNYEAALRFTHKKKRYYPGGVNSVFKNPDGVIGVFTTMSWVDIGSSAAMKKGAQETIHSYR